MNLTSDSLGWHAHVVLDVSMSNDGQRSTRQTLTTADMPTRSTVWACHTLICGAVSVMVLAVVACFTGAPAMAEDATADVIKLVVGLLSEKDKDLRAIGLEQVRSEAKGTAATKEFVAQLPKLSPEAQIGLLSALADRGDVTATPSVRELISSSKDEPVRVAAAAAIGKLGDTADVGLLVKLLAEGSAAEKSAARVSLVRLAGEKTPATIAAEIGKGAAPTRVAVIEILATRRALDTVPTILEGAVSDDAQVRGAAMTALAQLATPDQLAGMLKGVLKAEPGKERDAAERAVATIAAQIDSAERRSESLLAVVNGLDPDARLLLLPTIGRVGGPASLKVVESNIAVSEPKEHEVGIRAISNWPDAAIAPRLVELVKTEKDPKCHGMALAALVRVAPLPDKRTDAERLALLQQALSLCQNDEERQAVVKRARAIRTIESLRFLLPYLDDPAHAQLASESIVELAHHRGLREPNKPEFDKALDRVMATSKDAVVVDRAKRYKAGQTWVRPKEE